MSEWLLLGELMQAAQRRSRREASRFSDAVMRSDRNTAVRSVAAAHLEGVRTAFPAHASTLRLSRNAFENLPVGTRRALLERAEQQGQVSLDGVLSIVGDREEVTRAEIEARGLLAVREAVWAGQDDAGREAAALAEAEFKTWVRSWPRTEERDHHDMLEGVIIPSEDKFTLPGGPNAGIQIDGPRDWINVSDPAEWLHCGHALRFSTSATGQDVERTRQLGRTVYEPPTPGGAPRPARRPTPPPAAPAAPQAPARPLTRREQLARMDTDEIERYVADNDIADVADLKAWRDDPEAARDYVDALAEMQERFDANIIREFAARPISEVPLAEAVVVHERLQTRMYVRPNAAVLRKNLRQARESGWNVPRVAAKDDIRGLAVHEFAHTMAGENILPYVKRLGSSGPMIDAVDELKKVKRRYSRAATKAVRAGEPMSNVVISGYARTNLDEFIAEAFTDYILSPNPSPYSIEVGEILTRYFGRRQ